MFKRRKENSPPLPFCSFAPPPNRFLTPSSSLRILPRLRAHHCRGHPPFLLLRLNRHRWDTSFLVTSNPFNRVRPDTYLNLSLLDGAFSLFIHAKTSLLLAFPASLYNRRRRCPCLQMVLLISVDDVKREVKILQELTEHENLAQLYDAFEDDNYVYIATELCKGGELLDRILAKKDSRYTEKDAAIIVRKMLKVATECHLHGLVHRDMKPEVFNRMITTPLG